MPAYDSLSEKLRFQIQASGPITFRDWMDAALYDPELGYYCRSGSERWGRKGDYRTSPERSALFAATFARYFVSLSSELVSPSVFTILESGAGAGYFAHGILQTLQAGFPSVYQDCCYLIDERSDDARGLIAERLHRFGNCVQFVNLAELEPMVGIVFANELLDAFPVHRVTVRDGRLMEFYVGVDANGEFEWQLDLPSTRALEQYSLRDGSLPAEGQTAEVNLEIENWLQLVAAKLKEGFLVVVDYGAEADELFRSPHYRDGSLRAFRRHQFVPDVLADPGLQDVTTTIDWTHVRRVSAELEFQLVRFERQDKFLLTSGILDELEAQTARLNEGEALKLRTEAREMILPSGMAANFQVLVLRRNQNSE